MEDGAAVASPQARAMAATLIARMRARTLIPLLKKLERNIDLWCAPIYMYAFPFTTQILKTLMGRCVRRMRVSSTRICRIF